MIGHKNITVDLDEKTFDKEISRSRTFGFYKDSVLLTSCGLAQGVNLKNTLVFDEHGLMNDHLLYWSDEPVRHKVCDAIGDLFLAGAPIIGHFRGHRSGHTLNQSLIKKLLSNDDCWTWTTIH
jgi:UDP-3-O-[3-hydroxymyristoyl] N-acetylglucosamine deacetylase